MNKKEIITQKNIMKIADFLKESVNWLKERDVDDEGGCCHYNLSDDLAIYVGWSCGYDASDTSVILSEKSPEWGINAAVKIRNDADCSDFEFLNFPWDPKDGQVYYSAFPILPELTRRQLRDAAKDLLKEFVCMTNLHAKDKLAYK